MSKRPTEPTRRQQWLPYVRRIADMIALKDWRVEIAEELPAPDSRASCEPVLGRKYAILRLSEEFLEATRSDQRHTLVHELIHCHQGGFINALRRKEFDDPAIMLLMEYTTDGLADGFAHLLPLPPKG